MDGNMKNTLLAIAVTHILVISSVYCYKYQPPPISPVSIIGTWEGIDSNYSRYFRIDLNQNGKSYIAMVGGMTGYLNCYIYELQSMRVEEGKVTIIFKTIQLTPSSYVSNGTIYETTGILKVIGTGEAGVPNSPLAESGNLDAEVILEPDAPRPSVWKVQFIKGKPSLADWIVELSLTAAKSLQLHKGSDDKLR